MRFDRIAVAGILSALLISPAGAETANLHSIYQLAAERDAAMAAARENYKAGQEKVIQGRALLMPTVTAGANYNYSRSEDDVFVPNGKSSDSTTVSINLVQPIYNAANFASKRQGTLVSEQAKDVLTLAEQDLIVRVAEAYFAVLGAQEGVRVAEAQKRAFSENLDRAKLTFKVGTATITDKLEAQARYDLARADEIAANNGLQVARQSLASIIGEFPESLADLTEVTVLPVLAPAEMDAWINRAKENNAQIRLTQQSLNISGEALNQARAQHHPTLSFVGNASQNSGYNSFASKDNTTTTYSVALQLDVPIFTGGMTSSAVREANAMRDSSRFQLEQVQRGVVLQTQQAYLAVVNGRLRVDALQQALTSSQSAVDATRKGLEVGVRTNLDLLNAQQQFFATKRDFSVAKYTYLTDVLRLKSASGILSVTDVSEVNGLLSK
jgi:outer membrane protein